MGKLFPDAAQWPFVALDGYGKLVKKTLKLWNGKTSVFVPRVKPSQLPEYNRHMTSYFETTSEVSVPPDGFSVFKFAPDPLTGQLTRVKETTGQVSWGSPINDVFPVFQLENYSDPTRRNLLGFNLHSAPLQGPSIDVVLNCAQTAGVAALEVESVQCGALSETISPLPDVANNVIFQPIYPANNASSMVGIIMTGVKWTDILANMVPTSISGLDFVVRGMTNDSPPITYRIVNGVPQYLGDGDQHDPVYDKYERSRTLAFSDSLSSSSHQYTISMYPRTEFIEIYTTENPRNFTIGAVFLIVLTSITFLVYDHFMKSEFTQKQELLDTKRQFVRFISHEVRTPLNAVAMGLALLENEFQDSINAIDEGEEDISDDALTDDLPDLIAIDRKKLANYSSSSLLSTVEIVLHTSGKKREEEVEGEAAAKKAVERKKRFVLKINERRKAQIEDWRQLVVDITENTSSAVFVLDDLLNYDKIETGSLRLELKEVNIWELLRKTVHTFELAAKQVKVKLTLDIEQGWHKGAPATMASIVEIDDDCTERGTAAAGKDEEEKEQNLTTEGRSAPGKQLQADTEQRLSLLVRDEGGGSKSRDFDEEEGMMMVSSRHALFSNITAPAAAAAVATPTTSEHRNSARPAANAAIQQQQPSLSLSLSTMKEGDVNVLGDGTRLAQVIRNLISNALKFTPEEGSVTVKAKWIADGVPTGTPREAVSEASPLITHPRSGAVCISVMNTGAGLTNDQLAKICSEGVQFNANELQGGRGSGLGLFISKGIVEQHGGTMVVTSEGIGFGTTFTVTLPLYLFPLPSQDTAANDSPQQDRGDPLLSPPSHITTLPTPSMSVYDIPHSFSDTRNLSVTAADLDRHAARILCSSSSCPSALLSSSSSALSSSNKIERRAHTLANGQKPSFFLPLPLHTNAALPSTEALSPGLAPALAPAPVQTSFSLQSRISALPKRVLVVDDAASNRKMLLRILHSKGCECMEARNGQEALDIFKKVTAGAKAAQATAAGATAADAAAAEEAAISHENKNKTSAANTRKYASSSTVSRHREANTPSETIVLDGFDAIFMDFEMPVLNGPDATKLIRAAGCRCLIVGITGNVLPADMRHFIDQGADAVLPKPLQLTDVSRVWKEHVARSSW